MATFIGQANPLFSGFFATKKPPSGFQELSLAEAKALMTEENKKRYASVQNNMDNGVQLQINGQPVKTKRLNYGGTKMVYEIEFLGKKYALAILGPTKHIDSWIGVLNEPNNTALINKSGLVANNLSKIIKVKLRNCEFPALLMKPYSEHPFLIFDRKNPRSSTGTLDNFWSQSFKNPMAPTDSELKQVFSSVAQDIALAIKQRLNLREDSTNLCLKDGRLRLYVNDLPYEQEEMFVKVVRPQESAEWLAMLVSGALANSFYWKYRADNLFLKRLGSLNETNTQFKQLLVTMALKHLS